MSDLSVQRVGSLLEAIGEKTPAPGGGAVAGLVGAIGAALARMVVGYSVGSKKLAEHRDELEEAATSLDAMRERLLRLADADAKAYSELNALMRLPEDDERRNGIADAAVACVNVPLDVVDACAHLLEHFERLAGISNRMLRSDLAIAAILVEATARASMWNVRVNTPLLKEHDRDEGVEARARAVLGVCADRLVSIRAACH